MKKVILLLLLAFGMSGLVFAKKSEAVSDAIVFQSNGKDAADLRRALILASNMRETLTKAKMEVVVYGPTVELLTEMSDEIPLIQKVQSEGIKIIACGRSLETEKMKASDLAPGIQVVPSGGVWIVNRQKQGWQYIKP